MESGGSGNHEGSEWDQEDQGIMREVSGIRRIRESLGKSVGSGGSGNHKESQWDQEIRRK